MHKKGNTFNMKYKEIYYIETNTTSIEYHSKILGRKYSVEIPSKGYTVYGGRMRNRKFSSIETAKNAIDIEVKYCRS